MLEVSLLERKLVQEVRRKQGELSDEIISWLVQTIAGVSDVQAPVDPAITSEELHEDLQFGRS